MRMTLLLIFAFLALTVGSFVYFIVTWDADTRAPVSVIQHDNNGDRA